MKRIEVDYWKPHPDKPGYIMYDRGRAVQEVFDELEQRLKSTGYLPDEYFLMDRNWQDGKTWPKDGDIFCTVDYGGSEGIYLDIYIKYWDEQAQKHRTENFATGKTLGESASDMDRMNLIASAVTQAFHSDGVHARYIVVGGDKAAEGAVVHLNPEERQIVTEALLREWTRRQAENLPCETTGQLLRRVSGETENAPQEEQNENEGESQEPEDEPEI